MSGHAHHGPRDTEDLPLDPADGEEAHQHGAGTRRRPALPQAQRHHVLAPGQVYQPLLVGVPGGEVQTLEFTAGGERRTVAEERRPPQA